MPVASKNHADNLTPSEPWKSFGDALTAALLRSRRAQKDVAKALGISDRTLSDWKRGRSSPEKSQTTFALERELGCEPGELSVHLGYLPVEGFAGKWEEALRLDPNIDDSLRDIIMAVVKHLKKAK